MAGIRAASARRRRRPSPHSHSFKRSSRKVPATMCGLASSSEAPAAFHEYDFFRRPSRLASPTPLRDRVSWTSRSAFARAAFSNIGSRLWKLLMELGFASPDCRAEYPVSGGPDSVYYEWLTESFRSIHARAIALGSSRKASSISTHWNNDCARKRPPVQSAFPPQP